MKKRKDKDFSHKINPFTEEQRRFVRKAFMIPGVQEKFNDYFETNFIYCEDTCSIIPMCYKAFKE
jgi:hypothetical protein